MRDIKDFEYWESVAEGPLPECVVEWEGITRRTLDEFGHLLEEARGERAIQAFLQCYPIVLIQILRGGHRRWAIPQKRLGEKHVTDFILGEFNSLGYHWYPVELESPTTRPFTKAGDPSKALTHAIRQIQDWRSWLNQNLDYARRPRAEDGLELKKIRSDPKGIILIGRRHMLTSDTQSRREQMSHALQIDIHSFDHLFDTARSWLDHISNSQ